MDNQDRVVPFAGGKSKEAQAVTEKLADQKIKEWMVREGKK